MSFPGCFSGTVKTYNFQGQGTITTDDGLDIAVQAKSCTDGKTLQVGDKVQFDLEDSPSSPGEMVAGNVSGGTATPGGKGGAWGASAGGAWGGGGGAWGAKGGKDAGWGAKGGKDAGKGKSAQPTTGRKMKLCTNFPEGTCRRGENCTFAHSEAEIGTNYDLRIGGAPTGQMTGWVKTFTPDKGFGFLTSSDGQDYFFHQKQFVDGTSPVQGDSLVHDLEPSPLKPGQFQASNITGGTGPFIGLAKGKGKDGKGKGKGKDGGKGKGKSKDGGKGKGKDDGKGGKGDGPRLTGKKHQMCTHFPLGTCRKMDMCTFAHSEAEVGTSYDHSGGAGGYGAAPKGGGKGAAGPYGAWGGAAGGW